MIEFIKYDGKWPCLCFGTLSIKVNGKAYHLDNVLISGGEITHNGHWEDICVSHLPWKIDLNEYPELKQYEAEILEVVNDNIEYGCCGGCI